MAKPTLQDTPAPIDSRPVQAVRKDLGDPVYRISELSFIDNRLVEAGDEFTTRLTPPAPHWIPLNDAARQEVELAALDAAAALAADQANQVQIRLAQEILQKNGLA